ncbi:PATR-1 protein [Aphelenchoides avenae]|nr:PATR-1 protein [Aphelenchus avenae]
MGVGYSEEWPAMPVCEYPMSVTTVEEAERAAESAGDVAEEDQAEILDFHADVDDEESTVGRVNTQKKLRALLLRIENASLVLLECEEVRRKMDSLPDEERAVGAQKIEERMAMVQVGVFHKDQLPTVMLIQKGRAFVGQYLLAARGPHRSAALRLVFETLPRYAKKAADDQPNTTLTSAISRAFAELASEDIGALLDVVPFDQLAAIFPVAPLAQELCVALVIGVSKNPWGTVRPALQKWLRSPSAAANAAVLSTFPRDDLDLLRTWLSATMLSPGSGSLAEKLVSAVGALSG